MGGEGLQTACVGLAEHAAQVGGASRAAAKVGDEWCSWQPAPTLLDGQHAIGAGQAEVRAGRSCVPGNEDSRGYDANELEGERANDGFQFLPDAAVQVARCWDGCTSSSREGADGVRCADNGDPPHHGDACGDPGRVEAGGGHVLGGLPQFQALHVAGERERSVHDGPDATLRADGGEGGEGDAREAIPLEPRVQASAGPGARVDRRRGRAVVVERGGVGQRGGRLDVDDIIGVSVHFDGHTAQVGLRAELREAYAHADGLRVAKEKLEAAGEQEAIRGRCPHLCCRRRYDELVKLRLEVRRASARSTSAPPSRRTSAEAALEAKVQEQAEKMKELEQEVTATRYQRQYHREVAKRASLAASSKSTELESIKLELSTREAHLQQVAKQKAALESRVEHQRERNRELQRRSTELARECAGAEAALQEAEAAMQEAEADAAGMEASNAVLESKVEHLETRSEELRRLKISLGKRGNKYGPRVCEPLPASSSRSGEDPRELLGVAPKLLSPQSKSKRRRLVANAKRRITDDADGLYELLGEGRDAVALATALDALDMLDELWETPQLWALRIKSHQALVALINEAWNAELAARMKKDYLLSDRDLDAIRCDFSMTIVNGKPVPRILVVNPYRPWDRSQQVHFPEPITKRCDGWAVVVKAQADFFGITINEEHEDMSERNFSKHLQQLVTRDEHTLESPATFGTERRHAPH